MLIFKCARTDHVPQKHIPRCRDVAIVNTQNTSTKMTLHYSDMDSNPTYQTDEDLGKRLPKPTQHRLE